jgi:hypothetical protein
MATHARTGGEARADVTSGLHEKLNRWLRELVAAGWFLPEYVVAVRGNANAAAIP